jgi:hypothetical protein
MINDPSTFDSSAFTPRKITHLDARAEQRLYWSRKVPLSGSPAPLSSPDEATPCSGSTSMNEKQISLLVAFLAAGVEYAVVGESPSTRTACD